MNLKDRQNKEEKKLRNSTGTTQTSNPLSAEQTLLSKVQELSAALTEATEALEGEKKRVRTQDRTISRLSSQKSKLASEAQEQQSLIAALRTEISEAQDINRSLQKDNQELVEENDSLRSDHGIESRKEVAVLRSEISRLHLEIGELKKQVNQSNVAAVRKAYDELENSRREAKEQLDSYQAFVAQKHNGILKEKNRIITDLRLRINSQKGSLWLYRDLLLVYVLCTMITNSVILLDLRDILMGIELLLEEYGEWICCPCYYPYPGSEPYPYAPGSAWAIRIASIIAGMALAVVIICLCCHICDQIQAQWCRLAARITISLLIIVSVLGPTVKEYLQWNTAALFFILSIISMRRLHRFEASYTRSHKVKEWKRIKNQNDESFFVTYHIHHLLALTINKTKKVENKPT